MFLCEQKTVISLNENKSDIKNTAALGIYFGFRRLPDGSGTPVEFWRTGY